MMLYAKKIKDDSKNTPESVLNFDQKSVLEVEGIMGMCAALSASGDKAEGWALVMKVCTHPGERGFCAAKP